ncbi:hypothetical protein FKM82_002917 [Ascaphus truei]
MHRALEVIRRSQRQSPAKPHPWASCISGSKPIPWKRKKRTSRLLSWPGFPVH